jgi:hypothetical protein
MEVAGEYIHGFPAPQHAIHYTTGIHPVVEYQNGLLCFERKAAMKDVGQFHFIFPLLQNNNVTPTSFIQVKTKPYRHAVFRRSLRFPPLENQQSDAHSQRQQRIHPLQSAYINASFPIADKGTA